MANNRPTDHGGNLVATPAHAVLAALFGGHRFEGVTFTKAQVEQLMTAYGFDPDGDAGELERAGTLRNLFRVVRGDGLRVMALLAQFLEYGEDPVRLVLDLASQAGLDVGMLQWDPPGSLDAAERTVKESP